MLHPLSLPSWELTYPTKKALLKMVFLFPRWDMSVPWRVVFRCRSFAQKPPTKNGDFPRISAVGDSLRRRSALGSDSSGALGAAAIWVSPEIWVAVISLRNKWGTKGTPRKSSKSWPETPRPTIYKWMLQLDDSKSLHRKWLFHQTSIYKWLFGVPGSTHLVFHIRETRSWDTWDFWRSLC